ncbi:hypothetical protein F5882DRAFT_283820, partial [Hyaloscypha sp. PMI_1271]
PYGELQLIRTPAIPYHTIAMDFILALPEIPAVAPWKIDGFKYFDAMMTQSYKASRKTLLIPGHTIYGAKEWAQVSLIL